MDLYEYEGKALFKKYNIPIPKSILLRKKQLPKKFPAKNLMLKAQVLYGKRRKQGLITFTTKEKIKQDIKRLKKKTKHPILIEEHLEIAKEYYLSFTINQSKGCYSLLFSEQGGIDIEEVPKNKIRRYDLYNFNKNEIQKIIKNKQITAIAEKLFKLFKEKDATLVEVNPLALVTPNSTSSKKHVRSNATNRFFCLDAKIAIDNNALYRQPEFKKINNKRKTPEQKKAEKYGIHYVPLHGNIGVIGNGAGLVMATLDLLQQNNLKPANFLDAAGGTTKESLKTSLDILLRNKNVTVILINIFGGITQTDAVAEEIVQYKKRYHPKKPMIIRLYGTNWEKAHEILQKNNIKVWTKIEDAIKELKKK